MTSKGIQIKVIKIEGIPLSLAVSWRLCFKPEYLPSAACSVKPLESITNRSLLVSSEYSAPEWHNEKYYHNFVADTSDNLNKIRGKFYVVTESCGEKQVASGYLFPFRECLPGRAVRHTLHLDGKSGVIQSGKSVTVVVELLADLDNEDDVSLTAPASGSVVAVGSAATAPSATTSRPVSAPPSPHRAPPPATGGASVPASQEGTPQRGAGAAAASSKPSSAGALSQSGSLGAATSGQHALIDETGLGGECTDISVLEQRIHILTRQLDRKERQLLDVKARLAEKTRKFGAVAVDLDDSNSRLTDAVAKVERSQIFVQTSTTKMNAAVADSKTLKAQLKETEGVLSQLHKDLVEQRGIAEQATQEKKRLEAELQAATLAVTNSTALGVPVHHVVSEARIAGLTAEITEAKIQLVRARGRESMLLGDLRTAQQARLSAQRDSEAKSADMIEMQRELDEMKTNASSKAAVVIAAAECDAREAREEKDELRKEVDRRFSQLQRTEELLTAADARATERERACRQAEQVLLEMRAAADHAVMQARADIADLQAALEQSRDREAQAMRQEKQATSETAKLRLAVTEEGRKTAVLESSIRSQNETIARLLRRVADLEADVTRERAVADAARTEVRDMSADEETEVERLKACQRVTQSLAQTLAEQLSEMRRERAQHDAVSGEEQRRLLERETALAVQREMLLVERRAREWRDGFAQASDLYMAELGPQMLTESLAMLSAGERKAKALRALTLAAQSDKEAAEAAVAAAAAAAQEEQENKKADQAKSAAPPVDDQTCEAWAQTEPVQFADDAAALYNTKFAATTTTTTKDAVASVASRSATVTTAEGQAQAGNSLNSTATQSQAVSTIDSAAQARAESNHAAAQSDTIATTDSSNNAPDADANSAPAAAAEGSSTEPASVPNPPPKKKK